MIRRLQYAYEGNHPCRWFRDAAIRRDRNQTEANGLIDDKPILWHIMNSFSHQGIDEFILALGYKSDVIKRWLLDLNDLGGDITIDTQNRKVHHLGEGSHNSWKVTALETGLTTQTGGRIAQCMRAFPGERVIATYGDGLANVSVNQHAFI